MQCKAEGQANADKRLTIFNTYAHPTDQPIAHLQGQHPMTASDPPAKFGADSRGDDESGSGQGRRSPQEEKGKPNQRKEEWNSKVPKRAIRFR